MVVFNTEMEFDLMVEKLGMDGMKVELDRSRKIQARALWFNRLEPLLK